MKTEDSFQPSVEYHPIPEHLEATEVFRNGPRYYAARVTDGERNYIYKSAIGAKGHLNDKDGITYTPAMQLAVEMSALMIIGQHREYLSGIIPEVYRLGNKPSAWYLRQDIVGQEMGRTDTPFFFADNALDQLPPHKVADYFASLQVIGRFINPTNILLATERRSQTNLTAFKKALPNLSLRTGLDPDGLLSRARRARDTIAAAPAVLTHGEAYPPHIIMSRGSMAMIDWENARLDHALADASKVWLRAFENPAWQERFLGELKRDPEFNQELWDDVLFLESACLFTYVSEIDQGPKDRRLAAADYCDNLVKQLAT